MTEPIANDATSPAQPDAVDEDTMTTGAPIDEGDAYESITCLLYTSDAADEVRRV